MSESDDAKDRAPASWSAAGSFGLVVGVSLALAPALLVVGRLENAAQFLLDCFPLLSLGWNVSLSLWIHKRGGSHAGRGALAGTALVFLASSGCWYMLSTFKGG